DYLSTGIAESLIKNLSQARQIRVLAYSTVSKYKGRMLNVRSLGRVLGVRAIVTGRISRAATTLAIAAELVDPSDGSRLWGEQYQASQTDVLAIQNGISRDFCEKLQVRVTVEERRLLAKRYTADPEAYRLYLKGRFHWNKRTRDGLMKGIE